MTTATVPSLGDVRALTRADLVEAIAIDAAARGRSRANYLTRRLAAAVREPALHVQLAAEDADGLLGFVLARVLEGEFGHPQRALRLEEIGVRWDAQGRGTGARLLASLVNWGRRHDIAELRTQAWWKDHRMVQWLDHHGFELAPNHIVDCAVDTLRFAPAFANAEATSTEINYADKEDEGGERLARDMADVRTMSDGDLEAIVRIDRHITGRDRQAYMEHRLAEAMEDSGVRVSLTARVDGVIAGYVMARADYGDFGRPEAVAVLDTIGVDPGFTHHGVGRALVSQLGANLCALQIERVETVVAPHDLALLGFLYDCGFAPSQRLPFARAIA